MSSVALYQALKAAGVDDGLAERAAAEIHPAPDLDQFATKGDLKAAVAELRTEMAVLRTEMAQQGNRIIIILGGLMALLAALARFLPAVKP
jgi:hypothetical protein